MTIAAKRRGWFRVLLGPITGLVLALIYLFGFLDALDNRWHDFLIRKSKKTPPDGRIMVVAIDESSMRSLGKFPWPRSTHARLIDRLVKLGVKTIAFDVLFVEPDKVDPGGDRALAEATGRSRRTIHCAYVTPSRDARTGRSFYSLNLPIAPLDRV